MNNVNSIDVSKYNKHLKYGIFIFLIFIFFFVFGTPQGALWVFDPPMIILYGLNIIFAYIVAIISSSFSRPFKSTTWNILIIFFRLLIAVGLFYISTFITLGITISIYPIG